MWMPMVTILFYERNYTNKGVYVQNIRYQTTLKDTEIRGSSITRTSEVCTTVMLSTDGWNLSRKVAMWSYQL